MHPDPHPSIPAHDRGPLPRLPLRSLLALAGGAVAMPLADVTDAGIITSSKYQNTVVGLGGHVDITAADFGGLPDSNANLMISGHSGGVNNNSWGVKVR